jgi:SP family arabinose:H+ symporter-like MFS transporter
LIIGVSGIVVAMSLLSYGFGTATYTLTPKSIIDLPQEIDRVQLAPVIDKTYTSDVAFKEAMQGALGKDKANTYKSELTQASITMNSWLILISILGFVASFAISLGPVMWVLFSELFPNTIRGVAISFVGLINSAVSFLVQWVFPWELDVLGSSTTFMIYGVFALLGLIFILRVIPETKGKTLEELEAQLVG